MSEASFKFEKANRSLMERLFEPPAVGKMSPVASVVAHALLVVWSVFVLFPIYWVIITSFKDAAAVNQGPFYIPFRGFRADPQRLAEPVQQRSLLRPAFHRQAGGSAGLQFLCLHRVARRDAPAHGAADLQDLPGLHQFHRGQHRGDRRLRRHRRHGGLRAGPHPVQAQVRQHHDVRGADSCWSSPQPAMPAFPGGPPPPLPLPCSSSSLAPSASTSRAPSAMATSCSGSFPSASCRPSWWSFRST